MQNKSLPANFSVRPSKSQVFSRNISRQSLVPRAWKVGKYWDNSGTQNLAVRKNNSEARLHYPNTSNSNRDPFVLSVEANPYKTPVKKYSSNVESDQVRTQRQQMCSMINYQNRDYNLITNTVNIFRPETTTTYKQKGLSDYIDCSKNNNKLLNPNYRDAYTNNPKVFHKSSGEFTHHHDSCIKLSGFGPFYRALG